MTTNFPRIALAISAVLAIVFAIAGPHLDAGGVDRGLVGAFKASSILVLAGLALAHRARLLAVGLVFGAVGDALLALNTTPTFLAGAGAFLIGHLFYIVLFMRSGDGVATLARPPRLFGVLAMIAAAITATLWLVPSDTPLLAPLSIYTAVLTTMAISTFTLPASRWLVMIGGVLFFISDGFVAHNLFHAATDPQTDFALMFAGWMIYWAGQAGICYGALGLHKAATRT